MSKLLTDHCKINSAVFRLGDLKVDPATINSLISLSDMIHSQFCGLFLGHEVSPVGENVFVRPSLSHAEFSFAGINAEKQRRKSNKKYNGILNLNTGKKISNLLSYRCEIKRRVTEFNSRMLG